MRSVSSLFTIDKMEHLRLSIANIAASSSADDGTFALLRLFLTVVAVLLLFMTRCLLLQFDSLPPLLDCGRSGCRCAPLDESLLLPLLLLIVAVRLRQL